MLKPFLYAANASTHDQMRLVYDWLESTPEFKEPLRQHLQQFREQYELVSNRIQCKYGN